MCMQDNTNYNRNYKDSLFRFIFNNKEAALSLYNAVNDSDYQDAIESTVTDCINQGVLAEFLRAHRAEVTNMLFKEYDSAAHIASEKEISYEEGVQDGIRRGLQQSEQAVAEEKARADKLQIEASILSYYAQSKSIDEIVSLCEQSSDFVVNILKKYNLR